MAANVGHQETGHTVPSLFDLHKDGRALSVLRSGQNLALAYMNWARSHRLGDTTCLRLNTQARGGPSFHPACRWHPISPEQAVALAAARYPEGRLRSISCRKMQQASIRSDGKACRDWACFGETGRGSSVDQYSGAILDVRAPDTRQGAGETFYRLAMAPAFGAGV